MINIYGIKNCDTCRKALKTLSAAGLDHQYSDFRVDGLSSDNLDKWIVAVGWEKLLNKRGTTWRNLSDGIKNSVNEAVARDLMLENPTLIKRPVFDTPQGVIVGFTKTEQALLGF
ncbi:arsenate reductase [Kiloniella sp. EL199]|uniref:arsenate reductase n=1 Tax=Kiloniella sp. EL199 TaxID=2107581 RepID=UPI000EA0DDB4|nr:arsenate reductase [Kiloniella sp. EL199]